MWCWFTYHGLAAIYTADGPKLDRITKDIIETDFLAVTFNLAREKYFSF